MTTIKKAMILDTETSGRANPEIIENGYLLFPELTGAHLLATPFEERVQRHKPLNGIEFWVSKNVHGIYMSDVIKEPVFNLETFLKEIPDSVEYLIGHNISYDWRVLGKPDKWKRICTVKLARLLWPDLKSHKLSLLIQEFFPDIGTQLTKNAHGAIVDCKLCMLIIDYAMQEFEINTWEDLYELAGQG